MDADQSPFAFKEEKNGYKLYSFLPYYPINRYSDSDLTKEEVDCRVYIWKFKDGIFSKHVGELVTDSLRFIFTKLTENEKLLCIIPASTRHKTEIRFKKFCEEVSNKSDLINGYDYIINKLDHEAGHYSGVKLPILDCISFQGQFKYKNIILFDDVTTRGKTFLDVAQRLTEFGASNVVGIFLGKTTYKNKSFIFDDIV